MGATLNPAVDVGPTTKARPGLALLLAILAVPGTTMVWDLDVPVPGLWIGGPLGVAAIVLALRARREPLSKGASAMAMTAIVLATLALGQMIVVTAVSVVS
jgi:hypothetical protein